MNPHKQSSLQVSITFKYSHWQSDEDFQLNMSEGIIQLNLIMFVYSSGQLFVWISNFRNWRSALSFMSEITADLIFNETEIILHWRKKLKCACAYENIKSPGGFKLIYTNHTGFTTVSQSALLQSPVTFDLTSC